MGRLVFHALLLVGVTAAPWRFAPAAAQCRLCSTPTTAPASFGNGDPIAVQIETTLDFDRLVLAGQGQGAAVIRPDGSRVAEGALAGLSARAVVGTAIIRGTADRTVRVELPSRIELYSISGARITVDDVASDLPLVPRLDAAGNLAFRFGGRVVVSGDADGEFRGDLPITVEYQ